MHSIKIKATLLQEMLATCSANKALYERFIASLAPDARSTEEEVAALGPVEVGNIGRTVFPRMPDGRPFLWNYQIKGFFKEACAQLIRCTNSATYKAVKKESAPLKAYRKIIDGLIFVQPRRIPVDVVGDVGDCQRPLRAQTAQGERIALARSETAPEGSSFVFEVELLEPLFEKYVREWLDYGRHKGLLQWRGAGMGRFTWEEVDG